MKKSSAKRQQWWKRIDAISPGVATLLGIAFGVCAGLLTHLPAFRDFPDALGLFPVVLCGIAGYFLWLVSDPTRADRFGRIVRPIAVLAIVGLLAFFPGALWQLFRSEPVLSIALFGFVAAVCAFVVATGWGLLHLLGYLASQPWRAGKHGPAIGAVAFGTGTSIKSRDGRSQNPNEAGPTVRRAPGSYRWAPCNRAANAA